MKRVLLSIPGRKKRKKRPIARREDGFIIQTCLGKQWRIYKAIRKHKFCFVSNRKKIQLKQSSKERIPLELESVAP